MKLLLLFSILTSTAWARIGEKPEQLEKRYGTPIAGAGTETLHFKKNDIYITAVLWKGVCHCIHFSNCPPGTDPSSGGYVLREKTPDLPQGLPTTAPLTKAQMQILLDANSGGAKWIAQKPARHGWLTEDRQRTAITMGKSLQITTAEFTLHLAEQPIQQKAEQLDTEIKRVVGF